MAIYILKILQYNSWIKLIFKTAYYIMKPFILYLKAKHAAKSQTACEGRTESYGSHVDRQACSEIIILSVNFENLCTI